MRVPNQRIVWNKIAEPWKKFRVKPIEEVTDFLKNKKGRILDLGCGSGRNFSRIEGITYAVDFSKSMIEFAKQYADKEGFNVELTKAQSDELPFSDNFFDDAIFIAVLHCIKGSKKRERSLRELFRVLKPDSEAFITVWNKNQQKFSGSKKEILIPWKQDGEEYTRYYYLYDKNELEELLRKVGFKIVQINDAENPSGLYSKRNINVIVKKP